MELARPTSDPTAGCAGEMKPVAEVGDPIVARKTREHLGLPSRDRVPPGDSARNPGLRIDPLELHVCMAAGLPLELRVLSKTSGQEPRVRGS